LNTPLADFQRPLVKPRPTKKIIQFVQSFTDKRLGRLEARQFKTEWNKAVFLSKGKRREGRQIYRMSELANDRGMRPIVATNRDAAKAYIVSQAANPGFLALDKAVIGPNDYVTSKGFALLLGIKGRKKFKKRFGRKGRKRFSRKSKRFGRPKRSSFKKRRGGRKRFRKGRKHRGIRRHRRGGRR